MAEENETNEVQIRDKERWIVDQIENNPEIVNRLRIKGLLEGIPDGDLQKFVIETSKRMQIVSSLKNEIDNICDEMRTEEKEAALAKHKKELPDYLNNKEFKDLNDLITALRQYTKNNPEVYFGLYNSEDAHVINEPPIEQFKMGRALELDERKYQVVLSYPQYHKAEGFSILVQIQLCSVNEKGYLSEVMYNDPKNPWNPWVHKPASPEPSEPAKNKKRKRWKLFGGRK